VALLFEVLAEQLLAFRVEVGRVVREVPELGFEEVERLVEGDPGKSSRRASRSTSTSGRSSSRSAFSATARSACGSDFSCTSVVVVVDVRELHVEHRDLGDVSGGREVLRAERGTRLVDGLVARRHQHLLVQLGALRQERVLIVVEDREQLGAALGAALRDEGS